MTDVPHVTPEELVALEAALLNTSGAVPLHNRFRALFTLKALKDDRAVEIITKGTFHFVQSSDCVTGVC